MFYNCFYTKYTYEGKVGSDLMSATNCCQGLVGSGYCRDYNFYWGNAVKVCGGVDHLPSEPVAGLTICHLKLN